METALMILQMAVELSLYNYRHKCAILHHQPSLSKSDWYSCYVHILYVIGELQYTVEYLKTLGLIIWFNIVTFVLYRKPNILPL